MSGLDRVSVGNLKVAKVLHDFILEEVMPGTGIDAATFWRGLDRIVHDFAPRNRALLKRRDELQAKIDELVKEILADGGRAISELADVADPSLVEAMVDRAEEQLGPVKILVNNAGVAW